MENMEQERERSHEQEQEQTPGVNEEQAIPVGPPLQTEAGAQQPPKEPIRDPRQDILLMIQNNMFMDAALQNLGYVLLGTAISRNEKEFNDPSRYLQVDFKKLKPSEVTKYSIATETVDRVWLSSVISNFEFMVEQMVSALRVMLVNNRVVLGTLRAMVYAGPNHGEITIQLVFIKEV